MKFYSHGKLLLSAEYLVLDGATSLAIPTQYGQSLEVNPIPQAELVWESFDHKQQQWLQVIFELPKLRIVNATFSSTQEGGNDLLAENLQDILYAVKELNPDLFQGETGYHCISQMDFPRNWGLGSSSTLLNNLAQWAKVNPYHLLNNTFKGSGYDIACAQANTPILYTNTNKHPQIEAINFNPTFSDQLYFVHLNKKQNSREGIQHYRQNKSEKSSWVKRVSAMSKEMSSCNNITAFETLLIEHETIISQLLQINPIQQSLFPDYFGQTKSLGAWGGDFILATGNEKSPEYFKSKGYTTILNYKQMALCR
ncbi:GYDIA family GHMP kinase [Flavobacteriaceae bacterium F08102]|nr:GYDIA family GHMP kinase [Flavobacteriaceae bacterium F08102]